MCISDLSCEESCLVLLGLCVHVSIRTSGCEIPLALEEQRLLIVLINFDQAPILDLSHWLGSIMQCQGNLFLQQETLSHMYILVYIYVFVRPIPVLCFDVPLCKLCRITTSKTESDVIHRKVIFHCGCFKFPDHRLFVALKFLAQIYFSFLRFGFQYNVRIILDSIVALSEVWIRS